MGIFIIADVGSNHRGRKDLALKAVALTKAHGADAVKFQLYTHEELYGIPGETPNAFSAEWLPELHAEARQAGIELMVTAFSPEGVAAVDPFVLRHKLASSELPHLEMIRAIKKTGKPLIASTGGASDGDVRWLRAAWVDFDDSVEPENLTLLECVAKYPAPPEIYDLRAMQEMAPGIPFGLSDHTMGNSVALAAVGAGASVIEKHLDPFPAEPTTPDSSVALNPVEFRLYVQDIREAESAMGDGLKQPRHQHEAMLRWRRRWIATKPIAVGETYRVGVNCGIYRSLKDDTKGWSPITMRTVEGMTAIRPLSPGDSIGP